VTRRLCVRIIKTNWFTLFREIIAYCENYVKHINTLCGQMHVVLMLNQALFAPCGGRLEYLHHSPASCRRQWKGNPVSPCITGPSCHKGNKYRGLVLQVEGWMQGWWPCSIKILLLHNPKTWKPDNLIYNGID
jgi:hypothetical protein